MTASDSILKAPSKGIHLSFDEYRELRDRLETAELRATRAEVEKTQDTANDIWLAGYVCLNTGLLVYRVQQEIDDDPAPMEALTTAVTQAAAPALCVIGGMLWSSGSWLVSKQMVCWSLGAAAMTNMLLIAMDE